eukprot:SAG22_NODE_773_length_7297_cov_102.041539_7_plen_37_part_00
MCYATSPSGIYDCLELPTATPVMTWTLARELGSRSQ